MRHGCLQPEYIFFEIFLEMLVVYILLQIGGKALNTQGPAANFCRRNFCRLLIDNKDDEWSEWPQSESGAG